MTATSPETFSVNNESLLNTAKKATTALLERTVIAPKIPDELKHRMKEAKRIPEIDRRLLLLTDAAARPEVMQESGKLPEKLVKNILKAAHTLLEEFPDDAHTGQTVYALARASDDTGEQELLAEALRIAEENEIPELLHPNLVEALHEAVDDDIPFREAYATVNSATSSVETPMRLRSQVGTDRPNPAEEEINPEIPMTVYESSFHPTIRRPDSPEYRGESIHPSLKNKS
jgi:hypothetical protein